MTDTDGVTYGIMDDDNAGVDLDDDADAADDDVDTCDDDDDVDGVVGVICDDGVAPGTDVAVSSTETHVSLLITSPTKLAPHTTLLSTVIFPSLPRRTLSAMMLMAFIFTSLKSTVEIVLDFRRRTYTTMTLPFRNSVTSHS